MKISFFNSVPHFSILQGAYLKSGAVWSAVDSVWLDQSQRNLVGLIFLICAMSEINNILKIYLENNKIKEIKKF